MTRGAALATGLGFLVALVSAQAAGAHVTADPAFVAVGETARITLSTPNERRVGMTGLVVEPGPGIALVAAVSSGTWQGTVDGGIARWTGGQLPSDRTAFFEVDLRADGEPGFATLRAVQVYADGREVAWTVPLTIVPAALEAEEEPKSHLGRAAVAAAAGLAVVCLWLLARRRRRSTLQDR